MFDWLIQPLLTTWFFGAFPFAVLSTFVAHSKGRSKNWAFVLGLVFGPFGFLMSLIVSRDEEVVERRLIDLGLKKRCNGCAETVKIAANKCRYCGEMFIDKKDGSY